MYLSIRNSATTQQNNSAQTASAFASAEFLQDRNKQLPQSVSILMSAISTQGPNSGP